MSDSITLTIPAFSPEEIAKLETEYQVAEGKELGAVRALRETYGPLAKHGGFIQLGRFRRSTVNYSTEKDVYLQTPDGSNVRGFLVWDDFHDIDLDQNTWREVGKEIYLTEQGEWMLLVRVGHGSRWEGSANWWACGCSVDPTDDYGDDGNEYAGGEHHPVTDAELLPLIKHDVQQLLKDLSESLKGLQDRLPTRFKKLRERAALAEQVVTSLAGGVK